MACYRENFIFYYRSLETRRVSVVGVATGLRAGRSGCRVLVGARGFLLSKTSGLSLKPTQLPIQWVPGLWGQGVKLTTHLPLMLRLTMSGAIHLFPLYAFMAWTGTTLYLPSQTTNCVFIKTDEVATVAQSI